MSMVISINDYAGRVELLKERNGELVDETNSAAQTKPALPRRNLFGPTLVNPLLSSSVVLFSI